jgi:FixJ family two-component response regulator
MGYRAPAGYFAACMPRDSVPARPLIAIVDDDRSIRNALQNLLKAAGYFTVAFGSAATFLDSPLRASVVCLITDLQMPGMSGLELHEHLTVSGAAIPTIIITARAGELTGELARKAGITCLLTKPFPPDRLLECVHKMLAKAPPRLTIPRS